MMYGERSPHCQLSRVKALIAEGKFRFTIAAYSGGAALGFGEGAMVEVLIALTLKDFYKSMTTHADYRVWQDVYRPVTAAGRVYLKLTLVDEVLVVSFKEL